MRPTFQPMSATSALDNKFRVDFTTSDTAAWGPRFPDDDHHDPQPPDPRRWAPTVMRAILDVLSGYRPVTHLTRWVSLEIYHNLARQAAFAYRLGRIRTSQRPRLRRVQLSSVTRGRINMIGTFDDGTHVRAFASELVVRRDRWVVTDLQIG
ncbi:MAG: Rv3235 family protein [Bowdeniella nasicola]|nr:Rv3235 family protein [Bowdeniella nasicola]